MSINMRAKVLIVDDEDSNLNAMRRILRMEAFDTVEARNGIEALNLFQRDNLDLIITDFRMPEMDGMQLLKAIRSTDKSIPVIIVTAFGTIDDAVEAMKLGAVDFLSKPIGRQALLRTVQDALRGNRSRNGGSTEQDKMLGHCRKINELRRTIHIIGPTRASVFIQGESGTGKEVVANAIHQASGLSGKLVSINCAAIPENLLESELFGYERGAFTGANQQKRGLFELADRGTIFLDEIGEMSTSLQKKLLRVIEESRFYRVGGTKELSVNVRFISATNANISQMIANGRFREDLWFRLNVLNFTLPPLRERGDDILLLANSFLESSKNQYGKKELYFTDESLALLKRHTWPGNVRELLNVVERSVVLAQGPMISPEDLRIKLTETPVRNKVADDSVLQTHLSSSLPFPVGTTLKEMEDQIIKQTLSALNGDKVLAAKVLGINVRTIYRKLQSFES